MFLPTEEDYKRGGAVTFNTQWLADDMEDKFLKDEAVPLVRRMFKQAPKTKLSMTDKAYGRLIRGYAHNPTKLDILTNTVQFNPKQQARALMSPEAKREAKEHAHDLRIQRALDRIEEEGYVSEKPVLDRFTGQVQYYHDPTDIAPDLAEIPDNPNYIGQFERKGNQYLIGQRPQRGQNVEARDVEDPWNAVVGLYHIGRHRKVGTEPRVKGDPYWRPGLTAINMRERWRRRRQEAKRRDRPPGIDQDPDLDADRMEEKNRLHAERDAEEKKRQKEQEELDAARQIAEVNMQLHPEDYADAPAPARRYPARERKKPAYVRTGPRARGSGLRGNPWIQHVRSWAAANGCDYSTALKEPACRADYGGGRAKKRRKKMSGAGVSLDEWAGEGGCGEYGGCDS